MEKRYSCCICAEEAGQTVKQILTRKWKLGSGQIKKAKFRKNGIQVNGKQVTVRYILEAGDFLEILLEEKAQASSHLIPVEGELRIIYEDADMLVVEKPAGIVCHPSAGHYCDSMANLMVGYFAQKGEGYVVRLAGRLDKGTSGLLLYAKHAPALTELERQRADGRMKKEYYAILDGCPDAPHPCWIEAPLGPDESVPMKQRIYAEGEKGGACALTNYQIVWQAEDKSCSLAKVSIATGRTHQIRAHMSGLGHPLVGDSLYGGSGYLERPALHAFHLSLEHPVTGESLEFFSEMPSDMKAFLSRYGDNSFYLLNSVVTRSS